MNPNRWDIVRCAGDVERAHGIKFVLVDKRTRLVVASADGTRGRRPLVEHAEDAERTERARRQR